MIHLFLLLPLLVSATPLHAQVKKQLTPQEMQEYSGTKAQAESGNKEAQYNLGAMHYKGTGVSQNYAEAFKWWSRAAKQGCVSTICGLGVLYRDGYGPQTSGIKES